MNIIVIGLGSMGKRRIKLLKTNFPEINVFGIDLNKERCMEVEKLFGIETRNDPNEIFSKHNIDAVFISTSPISHSNLINTYLNKNTNIFTEINLVDNLYDENIKLANEKNLTLFLSSTQLYRKEIIYISNIIKQNKNSTNYIYHIGNYLPDWHPWENYKNFFVGNKKTNGCREILAIELPWIINTFGKVKKFNVLKNKISNLDIDYPDNFIITFEHKTGDTGVLIVDLVSRKAVRNLEVINEDFYIKWDGSPLGLENYNFINNESENIYLYDNITTEDNYNETIIENAYLEEIHDFLNTISKNMPHGKYSFEKDKYVLNLIDDIENFNEK